MTPAKCSSHPFRLRAVGLHHRFASNPGFVGSASGHQSGWGQQDLACNLVAAG